MSANPFEAWRPRAERVIDELIANTAGVGAVVVSSEDGFEIAARAEDAATSSRISAMASSMSALGSLASREADLGRSKSLLMESDSGLIVMVQSFHAKATLTVTVVAQSSAIMGQVLYASREAAKKLEEL
jgi:uncharacterized protein